ncbi:ABC transporter permease [Brucella abortus]|nr:ABC transporter permease [Brucella abortus]
MKQILALLRKRLVGSMVVLLIVVIGCFFMLESAPGDAVDAYGVTFGGDAGQIAEMRARWGLDQSVWHRLGAYLAALAQGNLGWSVSFNRPIFDVISERLPNTLLLMGAATALSFAVGSFLGVVAGPGPAVSATVFCPSHRSSLYAVPGFWLALVLVILFSIKLRWLPSSGIENNRFRQARAGAGKRYCAPPDLAGRLAGGDLSGALSAGHARGHGRYMAYGFRACAAGKGISRPRIVLFHVARNALLPLVTVLGVQAASMLGGSVVIESVFAVPGLGRLAQEAVASRDTPLLLGVIITSALMVILVNFVIDLVYLWLDPRIAAGGRA